MNRSRHSPGSRGPLLAACAVALLAGAACDGAAPRRVGHAAGLSSGASCPGTDAHQKHINLFACSTCHPQGATYGFDVPYTFPSGATTTAGGTLSPRNPTTPTTCSVGCHHPKGAPANSITWDAPGPLACTECHETTILPPSHPSVAANATREECQACHVAASHMDGAVAVVGHEPGWSDPASPQFHASAANAGLAGCQGCHGQDLAGGAAGVSCATCHDANLPAGVASWTVNCVMCHGGTDAPTGAPPEATWGNAGDPLRVGAHTRHGAGSAIAPALGCSVCHATPVDALSSGHVDGGTAEVVFGGIAAAGAPQWNRAVGTCAVYCHGATLDAGGSDTAPSWTGGPVACGACHGTPPPTQHPVVADLTGCVSCHPETMDATGAVIPPAAGGMHLDGVLEVSGTHAAGWMDTASPDFHAYSANRGLAVCQECHGPALDGIGGTVSIGCQQCHGATWKTTCTMCHGGTGNPTGAPPEPTWGSTSVVAVGAHGSHVGANPVSGAFGCEECHTVPVDALSSGHLSGSAGVSFAGAVSVLAGGTWNFPATGTPTCSSTYCHGNFVRGIATNAPDWTGANQAACGTCHYARPASYLHNRHQRSYDTVAIPWWPLPGGSTWVTCDQCHDGIAASTTSYETPALTAVGGEGPALHVNGTPDVVFKAGGTYAVIPGQGVCSSLACHPGETKYWPR